MKICTTSQRLKQILSERNLKQIDVVRLAEPYCRRFRQKLGRNDLSQFVSGKVSPGQWKLTILGLALNVSEAWLMGYDVPMERTAEDGLIDETTAEQNARIADLVKAMRQEGSNVTFLPSMRKIPLLGTIACGEPILAEENLEGEALIPDDIDADFALRCKGDSMIGARILDGDIVYIRQQPTVENGEIAAVLIDNEATLKRVRLYPDHISLEAENPNYRPMVYWDEDMNKVRILGKAVAFVSKVR